MSSNASSKRRATVAEKQLGFTLLELMVSLLLLALMSAILYGSLSLSGMSWERGGAKAEHANDMRLTQEFLRRALTSQHPLVFHKVVDQPLYFLGTGDTLAFASAIPGRAGGGMYYFRIALRPGADRARLTLSWVIPDYAATALPEFRDTDSSVLADDIAEVHFAYFGRDPDAADAMTPTWRDRWDDPHLLPTLIRMDVKPAKDAPWPPLIVEPWLAPEAGCRAWDSGRHRCVGI